MGYFNIIDSLSDKRVDEGMIDSISKNSSSASGDKLLWNLFLNLRTMET